MSESPPNTITVTLLMDTKHDVRAVRLLLKRLLRAYDLKCVGLAGVSDEQEACPPMVDTINAAKCKAMFGATAGEANQ